MAIPLLDLSENWSESSPEGGLSLQFPNESIQFNHQLRQFLCKEISKYSLRNRQI